MYLGEILIEMQCAAPEDIEGALVVQRSEASPRRIGEILIEREVITEEDLLSALARQYRTICLDAVEKDALDPDVVKDVPFEWARSHTMLPIKHEGKWCVLTADPTRVSDIDDLALLLGRELTPVLALEGVIQRSIEQCYYDRDDSAKELIQALEGNAAEDVTATVGASDLLQSPGDAPVTQLVNLILLEALKASASDVHIEPREERLQVRYRVDGLLYEQASPPKRIEHALVSRLKVMGNMDIAEKRLPQDGMARVKVGDREVDIRISTIPVAEGERVVLRLLNVDSTLLPLGALGMPEHVLRDLRVLLQEPHGSMWVTGPTGSGKTTTLYAALRELDTERQNILTIEDPIEYQLADIGQMAVRPKIGLTFSQGLRHILRQDPDVILVGETRDLETAEIAIRASLTGHLVFSTLHTNDAVGAVVRLHDIGVPAYLVASATRAVLAQRLVRRLCPECRRPRKIEASDIEHLGCVDGALAGREVFEAVGCEACRGGYLGRTGVYEMLVMDEELRESVRQYDRLRDLRAVVAQRQMPTLLDDAMEKVFAGETSFAEVLRAVGRGSAGAA
jgi:general secretion pathway protein E